MKCSPRKMLHNNNNKMPDGIKTLKKKKTQLLPHNIT